jgi:hypothetical protein
MPVLGARPNTRTLLSALGGSLAVQRKMLVPRRKQDGREFRLARGMQYAAPAPVVLSLLVASRRLMGTGGDERNGAEADAGVDTARCAKGRRQHQRRPSRGDAWLLDEALGVARRVPALEAGPMHPQPTEVVAVRDELWVQGHAVGLGVGSMRAIKAPTPSAKKMSSYGRVARVREVHAGPRPRPVSITCGAPASRSRARRALFSCSHEPACRGTAGSAPGGPREVCFAMSQARSRVRAGWGAVF